MFRRAQAEGTRAYPDFVPLGPIGTKVAAITGLLLLTSVNVLGVKAGAVFSNVFTVLKLVGIVGLVAVGLAMGSPHTTDFSLSLAGAPANLWGALALGMVGVLWSYGGWLHATFASAEIKNPMRTLPLAMTMAAVVVTALYLLANLAYMFPLKPAQMAASPRVAAAAVGTVLGSFGGSLISMAIVISTFGVVSIYTLTAPRIYYAMAADGVFFKKVAAIHPRFHTPAFSIAFQSLWAVVLILFWGTFENLISYVGSRTGSSSPSPAPASSSCGARCPTRHAPTVYPATPASGSPCTTPGRNRRSERPVSVPGTS